ncbi:Amino acid polyamine transporter I protein [Rutstroemia sp. NJR-2017a BBW]|nr:Amino acid polyamine transporter I protein [Rutstroemia sp. NJR-2017a BBW]
MSMLGFSCTVMITWEGVLLNGGYAGSVYAYLVVWLGTLAVFATMGELASISQGPNFWRPVPLGFHACSSVMSKILELSNSPACLSESILIGLGWTTVIGWQAAVASGGFLAGSLVTGLIGLNHPQYTAKPWQILLLFYAFIFFSVFINTVISRALPKIEGLILIIHVLGFFGILIPLVYMAPHTSAHDVFTVFLNGGGFATQGLSTLVGMLGPMSEEIHNATVVVPQAMIFSIALNGILGFGMLIAALFCLGDVDTVLAAPYAFMAIFQQAVQSNGGATAMAAIVTILTICALISFVASASRMTWSFARDRGLPFWKYLSKVDRRTSIPLISIGLTTVISCLLALIILGSSVAFNDVLSLTVSSLFTSYLIGNGLLLYRRVTGSIDPYDPNSEALTNVANTERLSWGRWKLQEPFGTIVNAFGCAFMLVILFFSFWPTVVNPNAQLMNFSSLMMGSVVIFSVLYYLVWARKVYTGPVIEIF